MEISDILLISTQDWIHHPVPSRHHYIFEKLAKRYTVHVPHFHVSEGAERETALKVHEATIVPSQSPFIHYTMNAPYHFLLMEKIIRENDIDVVVASHVLAGTAAITVAKRHGIPVVFDMKDWYPDGAAAYYKNKSLKAIIREGVASITRYNLDRSDRIITVSPSLVHLLEQQGYNAQLITNGVDTDIFKPFDATETRTALGFSKSDFVVGFVGSIEQFFDMYLLVSAFEKTKEYVDNAKLLIVGSSLFTPYEDEIKRFVVHRGLHNDVVFAGKKPYIELPRYVNSMDVCTIPMRGEWAKTALPNKFFEYSACKKPIVSVEIPDVMQMSPQNVLFYENGVRDAFSHQLTNVASNPDLWKEWCKEIDVTEYSWDEKARQMETILIEEVNKRRSEKPMIGHSGTHSSKLLGE